MAEQAGAALDRAALAHATEAAQAAVETERIRNTLLASISHDFRTPLSSILGSATSLLDYGDRLDAAGRTDLLRHIREETERLDGMVRDLLSIGRIDAGALELRREWIDVREIAEHVVTVAQGRAPGWTFTVAMAPALPPVHADPILVEQALANVVANAIQHTPAGTTVKIEAVQGGDTVTLLVTDNGPGIPAEVLPRVFERFVRGGGHSSHADGGQGTGLGLAIARGIMAAHGGSALAESPVAEGRGTRIALVFPRAPASS